MVRLVGERGQDEDGTRWLNVDVDRRCLDRVFLAVFDWLQPGRLAVHLHGDDDDDDEPEVLVAPEAWEAADVRGLLRERHGDLIWNRRVGVSVAYDLCGAVLYLSPAKRLQLFADDETVIDTVEQKLGTLDVTGIGLTRPEDERPVEVWREDLLGRGFAIDQPAPRGWWGLAGLGLLSLGPAVHGTLLGFQPAWGVWIWAVPGAAALIAHAVRNRHTDEVREDLRASFRLRR